MRSDSMTRPGSEWGLARAFAAAVLAFRRELERLEPSGGRRKKGVAAKDPERGLGGEVGDPRIARELADRYGGVQRMSGPF